MEVSVNRKLADDLLETAVDHISFYFSRKYRTDPIIAIKACCVELEKFKQRFKGVKNFTHEKDISRYELLKNRINNAFVEALKK